MSKVLIDRELLSVASLHLEYSGYTETGKKLRALLDAPSGTPAMPVKAYYHEAPNEYGGLNKSVGLEVRKEFADAPLVLEADALARIACLEGEIAKRDARIDESESRYQRDVYGLNNEGDPIGGDPAGGYANDNARLRAELAAIKAQEPVAWVGAIEDGVPLIVAEPQNWKATPLYAAPVSEAKAQGVVMPEPLMAAITRADDVLHALSNWESSSVKLEQRHGSEWAKEVDAIRRELHTQLARLNATPVQQVSVPDGWKLVPVEPTPKMIDATWYHEIDMSCGIESQGARNKRIYEAMLIAAPAAPAADAVLTASEWTKDADEWGGALNYAAWEFINECPEKSALLFNNTKGPLRAAIMKYAELVAASAKEPSHD